MFEVCKINKINCKIISISSHDGVIFRKLNFTTILISLLTFTYLCISDFLVNGFQKWVLCCNLPFQGIFCILLQICPSDAMKIVLQIYQLKLQVAEIDSIAILQSILFQFYVSYCTEQEGVPNGSKMSCCLRSMQRCFFSLSYQNWFVIDLHKE